ncbi:MAG: carboxypeptidase regulatory-like domain-containing protein [candidate division Zixibacteria bacterium]|nr:carboxypeptidase regulatory-like domain-containing protein [candidate division Zixibacteria bacterium]
MKKVLIVLIGLLIPLTFTSLATSNELAGQVTDKTTGFPIAGANVHLWKDGKTPYYPTVTDSQGKFSIKNITEGSYGITIFHPSYVKKIVQKVKIRPNRPINLPRAQLVLEPIQFEFIEIEKQSFGNSKIMGRVLDKKTKDPLIGARVRLFLPDGTRTKIGAICDVKGKFLILNVSPRMYHIDIRYGPTYDEQQIRNVKVESGRAYTIGTIFLNESFFEGDTVIVRGHYINIKQKKRLF